jgi:AcrR family transcriptional regulator
MEPFSERQEQIINASIELISEQSIQALTIRNIAKKINVTDGAIYRHFPSKTSILLGIILPFQQQAEKTLKEACSLKIPVIAQLESIFTRHFEYFVKKPAVTAVIFSESIFQNDSLLAKEVFKLLEMHEEALSCLIERGHKYHEIRNDIPEKELIRVIIGSIRYTVTKWRLSNYSFDLMAEGTLILDCLKKLLSTTTAVL